MYLGEGRRGQYQAAQQKAGWARVRIGGYQVCHKWLNDRRKAGRSISDDDITHYHKIIVALNQTISLMSEIDKVIDAHGGWPIK